MAATLAFLPVLAAVGFLTLLPLIVILPAAPPMLDNTPGDAPHRRPRRVLCGWRITLSIGRVDDGLKASNLHERAISH